MVEEEKELTEVQEEQNPVEFLDEKPKNVFHYPNFTLAFLGALVSNLGNILYSFAVSFYILALTGNNAFIQGLYLATGGIVYVAVTLFGGVISDRFHKGKIMFICDYAKGAMLIALTLLLMLVIKDANAKVAILFVIAVISNFIAAIFAPAASSLLPHIVPEKSFQQGQSYYTLMESSLGILGVILAAVLYSALDIHVLFFIVGGCYVLSGVSEMFIKYNHQKKEDKLTVRTVFSDIGSGIKYIFSIKPLLFLLLCMLFINFFFTPLSSNFIPYFVATDVASSANYLLKDLLTPESWSSVFSVAIAIGMIITSIILSARKPKETIIKGLRISFLVFDGLLTLMTVFYILYANGAFDVNVVLIAFTIACLCIGLTIVTINIPTSTRVMTIVDKDKLGKVSSVVSVGSQGLVPLANFIAGLIISGLGASWLLVFSTSGFVLITIMMMVNRHVAKL